MSFYFDTLHFQNMMKNLRPHITPLQLKTGEYTLYILEYIIHYELFDYLIKFYFVSFAGLKRCGDWHDSQHGD